MSRLIIFFLAFGLLSCFTTIRKSLELEVQPSQHDRWNTPVTINFGDTDQLPVLKNWNCLRLQWRNVAHKDIQLETGEEAQAFMGHAGYYQSRGATPICLVRN